MLQSSSERDEEDWSTLLDMCVQLSLWEVISYTYILYYMKLVQRVSAKGQDICIIIVVQLYEYLSLSHTLTVDDAFPH